MSQYITFWYLSHYQVAKVQMRVHSLKRAFAASIHTEWKRGKAQASNPTRYYMII